MREFKAERIYNFLGARIRGWAKISTARILIQVRYLFEDPWNYSEQTEQPDPIPLS